VNDPIVHAAALPPALVVRARFRLLAPRRLPAFLGSAAHGALGRSLYRLVCVFPRRTTCEGCVLLGRCAYPRLMETPATVAIPGVRDQAPRGLVLAPLSRFGRSDGAPVEVAAGTSVEVRLTLLGAAIEELPVLVVALQGVARRGLGAALRQASCDPAGDGDAAAAMRLERIETVPSGALVYDGDTDEVHAAVVPAPVAEVAPEAVVIELRTPLRLKHGGRVQAEIRPEEFVRALARRANALALLHGGGARVVDEGEAAVAAAGIAETARETRRAHVRRYSARQRRAMDLPGIEGRLAWAGPGLARVWPLLRFGEAAQVGKGAALGFGYYGMRPVA